MKQGVCAVRNRVLLPMLVLVAACLGPIASGTAATSWRAATTSTMAQAAALDARDADPVATATPATTVPQDVAFLHPHTVVTNIGGSFMAGSAKDHRLIEVGTDLNAP